MPERGDNFESSCIYMSVSMQRSFVFPIFPSFLCTFMHVCGSVGGEIGGPENVRNVEERNQNVLLCVDNKKKKENPGRKRNTVASSWE